MYPPKKDGLQQRPKASYLPSRQSNSPQISLNSPNNSSKDLNKINRILENAKNYQKDKQKDREVKKDYMMEGLSNLNRQISPKNSVLRKDSNTGFNQLPSASNQNTNQRIKSQIRRQSEEMVRNIEQNNRRNDIYTKMNEDKESERKGKSISNSKYGKQISKLKKQIVNQSKITQNEEIQEDIKKNQPINIKINTHSQKIPTSTNTFHRNNSNNQQQQTQRNSLSAKIVTNSNKQTKSVINSNKSITKDRNIQQKHKDSYRRQDESHKNEERSFIDPIMLANRENQNTIVSLKSIIEETQQQLFQLRDKFFKSEEKRYFYQQKSNQLQRQVNDLRKTNDNHKITVANLQAKLSDKQQYIKKLYERIETQETNKNKSKHQIEQKMHYSNEELIDKVNEIRYLGSKVANYENKIKDNQYEITRLNQMLSNNQDSVSSVKKQYEKHVFQLQQQIQKMIEQRSRLSNNPELIAENLRLKDELKRVRKYEERAKQLDAKQSQRLRLIQKLESQVREKDVLIGHLKNRANASMDDLRIETLQEQFSKAQKENARLIDSYEGQILNQDKVIHQLTNQLHESQKKRLNGDFYARQPQLEQFQAMIKKQSEEMNDLRARNSEKTCQNLSLLSQLEKMKSEVKNLENSNRIIVTQLDHAQRNNNNTNEANSKISENQVNTLKKKLESINQQMQYRKKEINNKDNFIQNYIIGSNKQNNASDLIYQLERVLRN